ncbi:MAG: NAD(P)/FAD-dependent oxidoreductase [Acidobacteria bacterium]|nr:NAD(P)/FAD-dependent oxidoreductase [Acidobacteriota bacterium]
MPSSHDVIIVGGGHNSLVTAFYLARAGRKPLVLERRSVVGGCAVTEEFAPGFRCSTLAHAAGPLRADIASDMRLDRHGLEWIEPDPRVFAPSHDGRALLLFNDHAASAKSIAQFSKHDAATYPEFAATLAKLAGVIGSVLSMVPPSIDSPSKSDLWHLLKSGRQFRALGKKDMFRLLRWGPMAVADLVAEHFENELLRATIAARGIFGANLGPWSAGSATLLLLRAAADPHPAGTSAVPRGGMGALTQAMAAAAKAAGAEMRMESDVAQIVVKKDSAVGVTLTSGETLEARAVISGADPKRTLLGLVDPVYLAPGFIQKMQHFRTKGVSAKINLALDGLPTFTALNNSGASSASLAGRIHIGPEIDYLERAFDHSKYGEFSTHPYLDVTIPTINDISLAPAGKHVMSIYMQFAPPKLRAGDWDSHRDALADATIQTLAEYAPDLPGKILHRQVFTPQDLENTFSLTDGHIFHGELALDQLFTMRPLLNWARYATPIKNLFLCGSGTHPGNGLTGGSGANAARAILKHLR